MVDSGGQSDLSLIIYGFAPYFSQIIYISAFV